VWQVNASKHRKMNIRFASIVVFFLIANRTIAPGQVAGAQPSPSSTTAAPAAPDVNQILASAHQKLEHGDSQQAISMLEQLVANGKASPPGVQHELGIAYYRSGKLLSAEKAFAQAMTEDPNDMESVQMRGLSLYRLGRPADAIPYLERVKQWTPNANADANYVLGLCYLNSQRFDEARASFANQFGVSPDSGAAYLLLGKMLMQANLPEAAAQSAKKALELTPKIALAHFMLGEFYLFKSDTAQALREFEQEREINPANPAVYDRLGDLYTRSGQYQQAQEALAKAISLDTSSTGPFIQMGKVLLRRNDPQTSLLYLQHAEKMDPGNYVTRTLLGQAYRSLGREQEAKTEMDAAARIHAESELKIQPAQ
jgi:tetratricopeptide (TPR) repeat protein